jgi:hypothetical protein
MTLALFFLGWFAISLLLGAAWAAAASTRRCQHGHSLSAHDRAARAGDAAVRAPVGGLGMYSSDSVAS